MPKLPLLDPSAAYRPCIQDLLAEGPEAQAYWFDLFEAHLETLGDLPANGRCCREDPRWPNFAKDYLVGLARLRRQPDLRGQLNVLELTRYREERFAAHGFIDPFAELKQRENAIALAALPDVLQELDGLPSRTRNLRLVEGVLAGNLFDMGAKAAIEAVARHSTATAGSRDSVDGGNGLDFAAVRGRLRPRPWAVDDLDAWLTRWERPDGFYRQALYFVDNSGPDIVLGVLPLARELLRRGARVVLAANHRPALNDVTAAELRELLNACSRLDPELSAAWRAGRLTVVNSGGNAPLIDLSQVTPECCAAAAESDLLILEGMGRAIESNYDARFTVDTIKLALIKDEMVARLLGVRLFDAVFRFEAAG